MSSSIDWANEWFNSLVWILWVFVAAVLGSALVGWLLMRRTVWGRQFKRLAGPYFRPTRDPNTWGPLGFALLVLLFAVIAVRLTVLQSYYYNGLYTAMQNLDYDAFLFYMMHLRVHRHLRGRACAAQLPDQPDPDHPLAGLDQRPGARRLAERRGLPPRQLHQDRVDNPDQRIQEDVASFVSTSLGLVIGAIGSMLSLVSFTLILWQLSGPLPIFGVEIPRAMMFIAYVYVIIATVIAFRIGRPLVRLNFLNEMLTGSFRYALVRLRDASESVAFYRGERDRARDPGQPVRGGDRQRLGHAVPGHQVPGHQLRLHPGRGGHPLS